MRSQASYSNWRKLWRVSGHDGNDVALRHCCHHRRQERPSPTEMPHTWELPRPARSHLIEALPQTPVAIRFQSQQRTTEMLCAR
ncbi:hypothetical protein PAZ_c02360 [Cutibacterium acnes 266]|nr:hypothetical protein PAZ_c02360 [Cutibacterium acnes 266]